MVSCNNFHSPSLAIVEILKEPKKGRNLRNSKSDLWSSQKDTWPLVGSRSQVARPSPLALLLGVTLAWGFGAGTGYVPVVQI